MSAPSTIERAFESASEFLPVAVEFLESVLNDAGAPEEVVDRAMLSASEAIANAIEHGNRGRREAPFTVTVTVSESEWRLRISDEGGVIEDEAVRAADLPRDPLQTHGRGLFIIRELADAVAARSGAIEMVFRERPE